MTNSMKSMPRAHFNDVTMVPVKYILTIKVDQHGKMDKK